MKTGSLTVVGSGLKTVAHVTLEAQAWMRAADVLLYCVADPATAHWLHQQNACCEDLYPFYRENQPRLHTYLEMSLYIMSRVRAGLDVCVVFYGHPGVFSLPTHQAIAIARAEGYRAAMLPGISAEDCLFAEIGFDPAQGGCLSLEASELLLYQRQLPVDMHVILWQVGSLGDFAYHPDGYRLTHLPMLLDYLQRFYPASHRVFLYQASQYPVTPSKIQYLSLNELGRVQITPVSTLYLPPLRQASLDSATLAAFGMTQLPDFPSAPTSTAPPTTTAPKPSALADFLAQLAQQPALLSAFYQQPSAVIALCSPLNPAEQSALLSGDPVALRLAVTAGSAAPVVASPDTTLAPPLAPSPVEGSASACCARFRDHPQLLAAYLKTAMQAQLSAQPLLISAYLQAQDCGTCCPLDLAQASPPFGPLFSLALHTVAEVYAGLVIAPDTWCRLLPLTHTTGLAAAVPCAGLQPS